MAKHGEEARTRWQPKRVHSAGLDLSGGEEGRMERIRAEYDDRQRLTLIYERQTGPSGDRKIDYHAALREARAVGTGT